MKTAVWLLGFFTVPFMALADGFPQITSHPTNQTISPGANVVLSVAATGATDYQWRFNGVDIPNGTTASLTITNAQQTASGYYLALAKNGFGWTPSQMAYLSVVDLAGRVPLSNAGNPAAEADYQVYYFYPPPPITNGLARVVAGPALDQMQPFGTTTAVTNGSFNSAGGKLVSTVAAGQTVYYRVDISYATPWMGGGSWTQQSTVLKLVAGGGTNPTPSAAAMRFPVWLEWPDPYIEPMRSSATNQVRVPGESFVLSNWFTGSGDFGLPTYQWRKDGRALGTPSNFDNPSPSYYYGNARLTFDHVQPSDAGVYDVIVLGNNWLIGPKMVLSVQLTDGPGRFVSPRVTGNSFVSDFIGAAGRQYFVQVSTNLADWRDVAILTNATGSTTFSNGLPGGSPTFFRSRLLP